MAVWQTSRHVVASQEPWMVSFSGMAAVFGISAARSGLSLALLSPRWPERLPLIAPEHRPEVLESIGAKERVRSLSPKDFVDFLVDGLGAAGAVCGENFRFGFRAAGDAQMLKDLGRQSGEAGGSISSTKLREMLAAGQVKQAALVLGRPYRVLWRHASLGASEVELSEPANQIPADGSYKALEDHVVG
eukprot:Skav214517  [mRNA]  locus=scaffold410:59555:62857:+ [translate_table: standard]